MKAVVYSRYGGPERLDVRDVDLPALEDDGVLVRVRAASLNPLDWHALRGEPYLIRLTTGLRRPTRSIPGVDVAGIVEAVGASVTGLAPGDEVWGSKRHACAEYVAGPERLWIPKPENVTFEQAAAIPAAGVTALQALRDNGRLRSGESVLINGASGGVGTFAVQIAKHLGARVTGVTSTPNVELVRSLGADEVVDYTRDDFTRTGHAHDLVIDNAANRSLWAMRRTVKRSGRLVLVGASKGRWIGPMVRILGARLFSRFIGREMVGFLAEPRREDLLTLNELVAAGTVRPVIDRTYPLDEVPAALAYLETMRAPAKVIVTL